MSLYGDIQVTNRPDLENVRKLDLLPVPMVRRMMQYGIAIDKGFFADLGIRLEREARYLREEICEVIPPDRLEEFISRSNLIGDDDYLPMNVGSSDQLATLLFDVLKVGQGKQLKMTPSGSRVSTGKKQLEGLKREHPVIQKVLDYRERMKLKSTYCDAVPKLARHHPAGSCWCGLKHYGATDRVHAEVLDTRTETGRLATKNPNLQNIPSRTALGRELRKGFVASPGTRLVSADFSQEEMRIGSHYSQDANLIRIFKLGIDPHNETAKLAFNTQTPDYITQRTPSRNVNFGVFYGLGGPGLFDMMCVTYATANLPLPPEIDVAWCERFIERWFNEWYPGVKGYIEDQFYRARRYGVVWTLFGRVRKVPEVQSALPHIRAAGLRQAANMPVQGTGADWMRLTMGEMEEVHEDLRKRNVWVQPLVSIHDELLSEVEEEWAEVVGDMTAATMMNVMLDRDSSESYLRVPVEAESKIMSRWSKG